MPAKWATIVPTQNAVVRPRVTAAAGLAPKLSDGDVENSAEGPRAIGTPAVFQPTERWPTACSQRGI